MVMNVFDTDGDGENNFYAVNGPAFYYARYPIKVKRSQTVRIYLANLTEFDLINSFHLHGDFFRYYPTGTSDAFEYTDTVMLCQGQRGSSRSTSPTRELHVPRAPVGVRRARLDGLLRGLRLMEAHSAAEQSPRRNELLRWRLWALVPIVLLVAVVSLAARGGSLLDLVGENPPPPDAFDVRRVEFSPGEIRIRVTNPQREDLTIATVTVDDAIVPFTVDGPATLGRLRSATIVVLMPGSRTSRSQSESRARRASRPRTRSRLRSRRPSRARGFLPRHHRCPRRHRPGGAWPALASSLRRARPEWLAAFMALTGGLWPSSRSRR